jgi:arsenite-transporting ATPase
VINGIFTPATPGDRVADALASRGIEALIGIPSALASLPRTEVPLLVTNPVGIAGLHELAEASPHTRPTENARSSARPRVPQVRGLRSLVDELASAGPGVIMTMGKGGVGKTTIAAAIAMELARRGLPVSLSTTDPAAHVAEAIADGGSMLSVSRIDPEKEVAAYREKVLETAGRSLDPESLALLEEDLRSPCTEEIAVFGAFARTVAGGTDRFVVLDTAPTGHTLLLLDASEAYHREVLRSTADTPPEILSLLPRLRDPAFTHVVIVTLAEATPVSEARRLQDDLARAGIAPYAWIISQSLALVHTDDPTLRARGDNEMPHFDAVMGMLAGRTFAVPWSPEPPVGVKGLASLVDAG